MCLTDAKQTESLRLFGIVFTKMAVSVSAGGFLKIAHCEEEISLFRELKFSKDEIDSSGRRLRSSRRAKRGGSPLS